VNTDTLSRNNIERQNVLRFSLSTTKPYGSTNVPDSDGDPVATTSHSRYEQQEEEETIKVNHNDEDVLPGLYKVDNDGDFPRQSSSFSRQCLSCFIHCMGFTQNPWTTSTTVEPHAEGSTTTSPPRNSAAADMRLSLLSNFSTAYNVVNISLALELVPASGFSTMSVQQDSWCTSALIAGMICGQIAGGTLGDVVGRHWAMSLVMWLQVGASIGSSAVWDGARVDIYEQLSFWRFILGLGAGGVYPLAATLTAESSLGEDSNDNYASQSNKAKAIALTFMMQGVGYLTVPVVARILLAALGSGSQMTWRLLLALGALPGLLLTWMRIRHHSSSNGSGVPTPRRVPVSVWKAIRNEHNLVRKFIGTGGCWFLFDVLFYGNTLFQPMVLEQAFGTSETISRTARDSMIIALLALPGYFVSVYALGKQSPRYIQVQGFTLMGILYTTIAVGYHGLANYPLSLLVVYGATFFFSNYGPNATTFLLPSMTYSQPCRSTLNGLCAACGKAGALLGASVFAIAEERFGHTLVFGACGFVSLIGAVLTWYCVSSDVGAPAPHTLVSTTVPVETDDPGRLPMKTIWSQPSLFDFPKSTIV
jgi:PHS family inorganic phosphate transporter-like MFS transporter